MTTTATGTTVHSIAHCTLGTLRAALAVIGLAAPARSGARVMVTAERGILQLASIFDVAVRTHVEGAHVDVDDEIVVPYAELVDQLAAVAKGDTKRMADAQMVHFGRSLDDTPVLQVAGFTLPLDSTHPGEYPDLPGLPDADQFREFDRSALLTMTQRINITAGADELLPIFTAVQLIVDDALTLRATDRYRLAHGTLTPRGGTARFTALPPAKMLALVLGKLTGDGVFLAADPEYLIASSGPTTVWLPTVPGEYPDLSSLVIVPDLPTTFTVDRAEFTRVATKAANLSLKADRHAAVRLEITGDQISFYPRTRTAEALSGASVPATTTVGADDPVSIGLNPAYLLHMLATMTGDNLTMVTAGKGQRTHWSDPADPDYQHVVMGMRLP